MVKPTSGMDPDDWPYGGHSAAFQGVGDTLSLTVGRARGTVVVTVDGALDPDGCERLGDVLTDLIEGQGNLAVTVDLERAVVEPASVAVFAAAALRARRHGAKFVLNEAPAHTHEALRYRGLDDVLEVLPRRDRRGAG